MRMNAPRDSGSSPARSLTEFPFASPSAIAITPLSSRSKLAVRDIEQGVREWRLWLTMAWNDIRMRYRRSVLGPFWITLSMGFSILMMGLLYGNLFKLDMRSYVPHLTLGLLIWSFLQGVVNEGCLAFIASENFIKQTRLPYSTYVYRTVWRNLIILGHNAIVYLVVAVIFGIVPTFNTLLFVPGIAIVLLNAAWVTLLLGMICTRFRDIPQLIMSILQVVFFVTPIMWTPQLLGSRMFLVQFNPAFHTVEMIRAPLLGEAPTALNWYFMLGMTLVGCLGTFVMFRWYRNRISYWL